MLRQRRERVRYPLFVWSATLFLAIAALNLWMFSSLKPRSPLSTHGADWDPVPKLSSINDKRTLDIAFDIDGLCLALTTFQACCNASTAWDDWKPCIQEHLNPLGWPAHPYLQDDASFADFIFRCKAYLPWTGQSNHTAVLLDFRPLKRRMRFVVDNVMNNLPIDWQIQIVGGPSVCELAFELYAAEIAAQKVIVTLMGHENVEQVSSLSLPLTPWHISYLRVTRSML